MKRLTLSFDNGPVPGVTDGVLDQLRQHEVKATFFVCGKDIGDEPRRALVTRAREEGHWIGNHTFSHSVEFGCTTDPDAPANEISRTQALLGDPSDERRLFRPYGAGGVIGPRLLSRSAVQFLADGGYTCVLWNSVPRDWEDVVAWPARALRDIRAQEWTLVVLHDVPTGAMKQLPRFLDLVRAEGVEIVQAFPEDCVPIHRGALLRPIDHLISAGVPC